MLTPQLQAEKDRLDAFLATWAPDTHWQAPDAKLLAAKVVGKRLSNQYGETGLTGEYVIIVKGAGSEVYRVNLATLFALAAHAQ